MSDRTFRRLVLGVACVCAVSALQSFAADGVTIGVPEFPTDMNMLTSSHPAARFIRRALTAPLIEVKSASKSFQLVVADSVSVTTDQGIWGFRLGAVRASSGRALTAADLSYSIGRCKATGLLSDVDSFATTQRKGAFGRDEQWLELRLKRGIDPAQIARDFPKEVAECPIVTAEESKLFGAELGRGANVVAPGDFVISDFKAGREISLVRSHNPISTPPSAGALGRLVVRAFHDGSQALAALRDGSIDAFVSKEAEVQAKASKDETLLSRQCPEYNLILRRGLQLDCPEAVVASEIRYFQ